MKLAYRNIPILILGYNRPTHIKKLIISLRNIKPKKIYICLDGSKKNIEDIKKCNLVKKEINKINWKCVVKKKYNNLNLGCKLSVGKGIEWFFSNNKFGIILEDDCIPNRSFFHFCLLMNKLYKNNKKIFSISGSNFYNGKIDNDYYFSKYPHCWGWATWSRAWKHYDKNLKFWPKWKKTKNWNSFHSNLIEKNYWEKIFNKVKSGEIDSWAYIWTFSVWRKRGLTIIPKKNLIKNIGFDINATNSLKEEKKHLKVSSLNFNKSVKKPKILKALKTNDSFVFENHFQGKYFLWPWIIIKLTKLLLTNPKIFFLKILRKLS
ncbi:glycosyltransferase family A protein [Candidatus Pelagibacter sp.]|uniref:glycosyltransferase family A protein n=1 Tax=Candidatus Pelagibacter sp. TaxID=2024849 RepID=UPI003F841F0A